MDYRSQKQKTSASEPLAVVVTFMLMMVGFGFWHLLSSDYQAMAALDVPQIISFQGKLTDDERITLADGARNMKFVIYNASTVGTCLWSASNTDANTGTVDCTGGSNPGSISVSTVDGVFFVLLGDTTGGTQNALPDTLFDDNASLWLEVTISGETLSPRIRLAADPYAMQAGDSDLLDSFNTTQAGAVSSVVVTTSTGAINLTNVTADRTNTDGLITIDSESTDAADQMIRLVTDVNGDETVHFTLTADGGVLSRGVEDSERFRLVDSTNTDNAGLYIGDGSAGLDGTLSAQAGSLFLDTDGKLWVNIDGASDWSDLTTGGAVTLQSAYNGGNTISTTDNRDIAFTLADTTTDATFVVDLACVTCSGGAGDGDFIVSDAGTTFWTFNDNRTVDFVSNASSGNAFDLTLNSLTSGEGMLLQQTTYTGDHNGIFFHIDHTADFAGTSTVTGSQIQLYQQIGRSTAGTTTISGAIEAINRNPVANATGEILTVSGPMLRLQNNSTASGGGTVNDTASLLYILQNSANSTGNGLEFEQNSGSATGILVDQNVDAMSISIDSEATTATAFLLNADAMTTGNGLTIDNADASGVTTSGELLSLTQSKSFTADTLSGNMVRLERSNTLTSGASTATGDLIAIVNNDRVVSAGSLADSSSLISLSQLDDQATSAALEITTAANGTGSIVGLSVEKTGTGDGETVLVTSAGTDSALRIDMNGQTGVGSSLTDSDGGALHIGNTGNNARALTVYSDNNSAQVAELVYLQVDNTAFDGDVFHITNDGVGNAIVVSQDGNTGTGTLTNGSGAAVLIGNSSAGGVGSTGRALGVYSNQNATQVNPLVSLFVDNTAFDEAVLSITNDGANRAIDITQNGNARAINIATTSSSNDAFGIQGNSLNSGDVLNIAANALTTGSLIDFASSGTFSGNLIQLASTGASTGDFIEITSTSATATARALNIDIDNGNVNNTVIQLISDETTVSGTAVDTVKFRLDSSGEAFSDKGFTAGGASTNYYDGSITHTAGSDFTFTPGGATDDLLISTSNLKIGAASPNVTLNGEDFFVAGTAEVDGASRFDGAMTANGTVTTNNIVTANLDGSESFTVSNGGTGDTVMNLSNAGDFFVQDNSTSIFSVFADTTDPGFIRIGSGSGTNPTQGLVIDIGDVTGVSVEQRGLFAGLQSIQLADGATITNQRMWQFAGPSLSGVAGGGTETVTNAATVYIADAPSNAGDITITNRHALWVASGSARFDGRILSAAHDNFTGLLIPVNAGVPSAMSGTTEGDIVWDSSNNNLYAYDGASFQLVGGASGAGSSLQTAYNTGNTISATNARDLSLTFANTATDPNFFINLAGDGDFEIQDNSAPVFTIADDGTATATRLYTNTAGITLDVTSGDSYVRAIRDTASSGEVGILIGEDPTGFTNNWAIYKDNAGDQQDLRFWFGGDRLTIDSTTGATTFSDDIIVNGGNVNFGAATAIGDGGDAITIDSSGVLTISDTDVTFTGSGTLNSTGAGSDLTLVPVDDLLINPGDDTVWTLAAGGSIAVDAVTTDSTISSAVIGVALIAVDANPASAGTNQGLFIDYESIDDANANQAFRALSIDFMNSSEDAGDATHVVTIINTNNTSGTAVATDAMIRMNNTDATAASVTDGLLIQSTGAVDGITDAIDVSAGNLNNAINMGANFALFDGLRFAELSTGTLTLEDTGGNDMVTVVDVGSTANSTFNGTWTLNGDAVTTGNAGFISADALTTGSGLVIQSTSTATAAGAKLIELSGLATQSGGNYVLQAGTASRNLTNNTDATTTTVTSSWFEISQTLNANNAGAGSAAINFTDGGSAILEVSSNASENTGDTVTFSSNVAFFDQNFADASGNVVLIENAGSGDALHITNGANGRAIYSESNVATNQNVNTFTSSTLTVGQLISVDRIDSGTNFTGANGLVRIDISDTASTGNLMVLSHDGTAGTVIDINNAGTGDGINITESANGNALDITASSTTLDATMIGALSLSSGDALQISVDTDTLTTGMGIRVRGTTTGTTDVFTVNGSGDVVIGGSLDVNATSTTIEMPAGAATQRVCYTGSATGDGVAVSNAVLRDCSTAGQADFAEYFGSDGTVVAGDLVAISGEATETMTTSGFSTRAFVQQTTSSYQSDVIGVVSTNPYTDVLSETAFDVADYPVPVALNGRVPVKVTNEGGDISPGDYLVASSTVGHAMKATQAGQSIGVALESSSGSTDTVIVFINPQWYAGSVIGTDGLATTVSDTLALSSLGTADSGTTTYDSQTLSLRGSAWNGVSAESLSMNLVTDVTSDTDYRLSIRNTSDTEVAYVTDDGSMRLSGDLVLGGKLYPSDQGVAQNAFYIYFDSSLGAGMEYMRTNAAGWSTGSYDFAEMFPSGDVLEAGDIVVFAGQSEHVRRSDSAYDQKIAGIVSTRPGFLAGDAKKGDFPIALAGRVPTKVTMENGSIEIGDPLTTSSTPGYAMKATEPGAIVGYALEPYTGSGEDNKIISFVNVSYWGGGHQISVPGTTNTASQTTLSSDLSRLNMGGNIYMNGYQIQGIGGLSGISNRWSVNEDGLFATRQSYDVVVESYQNEDVVTHASLSMNHMITLSGSGELVNGSATISFEEVDPNFNDVISTIAPIRVFVTLRGEANGVYVAEADSDGFTAQETMNGAHDAPFDWYVEAYRKDREPEELLNPVEPEEAEEPEVVEEVVPEDPAPEPPVEVPSEEPNIEEPTEEPVAPVEEVPAEDPPAEEVVSDQDAPISDGLTEDSSNPPADEAVSESPTT